MRPILLLCFCLCFFGQTNAQQIIAPDERELSLTLVRQELETQIKEAKSQETVLRLTNRLREVAEAQLFFVYIRLYELSSSADRVALWREESRWWDKTYLYYRGDHTLTGGGDTAAYVSVERDNVHFVDLRTERLRQRLSNLEPHRSRPNHALQPTAGAATRKL